MSPEYPIWAKEFSIVRDDAGLYHLFYMRHNPDVVVDSTENDLGHAVSYDLKTWTQLGSFLHSRPGKWDNLHIWSPHVVRDGATWYMFYTGVSWVPYGWNAYQKIGVATSTDLVNWTRYDQPVLTGKQVPWVWADSSTFEGCQFRDAFVMKDPNVAGRWLMYYVGTPANARDQLIGGIAQATNLMGPWTDLMPLWCTDAAHFWGWCESLHMLQHGSLWYMFATTNSSHVLGFRTTPSPTADSLLWSGKYRIYDMANSDPISDAWFGSETFTIGGRDHFAVVNSLGHRVEIYDMVWSATAPNFSLASPVPASDVPGAPAAEAFAIARSGGPLSDGGQLLRCSLPAAAAARVEMFDVSGRRLGTLHDGPLPAGDSVVRWDGRDGGGALAPSGVYFAALTTGAGRRVARLPVLR